MARKEKKSGGGGGGESWLVTFSDLMTLLLTFFVLLLSMASMDRVLLTRVSPLSSNVSMIDHSGRGKTPDHIQLMLEILNEPSTIMDKLDRFKDLLFPNEVLPPELSPGIFEENVQILAHPEGVVIVLTEELLFPQGGATLTATARKLLEAVSSLAHYSSADVNISGHTDNAPPAGVDPYTLSGQRAMSVLEYFLQQKFKASRFSISGYGPDKPLVPNDSPAHMSRNRRVELLLKSTQWLGRYQ